MSSYNINMGGEDENQPCLCDPCLCDHDCGLLIFKSDEKRGENAGEGGLCTCDPCECETPPGSPSKSKMNLEEEGAGDGNPYQLDEFARAKEFFMNTSTKSGLCMYEHLVQVIRKILDERGPINPVDYLEEISMNVKRYKFQIPKDIIRDVFQVSPTLLDDSRFLTSHWKRVNRYIGNEFQGEDGEEDYSQGYVGGSFQNLLRLAYYLEHVNVGLPREEMFRLAIAIRDLTSSRPYITRARFWGKIFGLRKGYYVVEAEFKTPDSGIGDLWVDQDNINGEMEGEGEEEEEMLAIEDQAAADILAADLTSEEILGPQRTLQRAGNVVLDTEFLTPYSKTSGLSPEKIAQLRPKAKGDFYQPPLENDLGLEFGGEGAGYRSILGETMGEAGMPIELEDTEALEDAARWHGFMEEFMSNFPTAMIEPEITVPAEPLGIGVNRRAFYVCTSLGEPWVLLPITTPELINGSRNIRWALTGELGAPIRTYPEYPGKEVHYLRCLLARAAAGSLASPKGFYKPGAFTGEYPGEDEEDVEEEEEALNAPGDDKVMQVRKYDVSLNLITNPNLDFWVHHAGYILPQGRATWWNPLSLLQASKKKAYGEDEEEGEDEDYDEYEGEGGPGSGAPGRETGPPLFAPISNDTAADGRNAWTLCTSTSIFPEFQVVSIRSNNWTGSTCICTMKGKVDNIYFGDGLKFTERTYCPPPLLPGAAEYKFGPEISEIEDPSVEEEQEWLRKLELSQMIDEPKPVEEVGEQEDEEEEEEEEEETEYESDED